MKLRVVCYFTTEGESLDFHGTVVSGRGVVSPTLGLLRRRSRAWLPETEGNVCVTSEVDVG